MSSRRESADSVSLFPFLAVLVCAMGALILLLLVMTRRIRHQAELRSQLPVASITAPVAASPALEPPATLAPAGPPAPPPAPVTVAPAVPLPPRRPAESSAWSKPKPRPASGPPPQPIYVDPTYESRRAEQLRRQATLQRELEQKQRQTIAQLSQQRAAAARGLAELEAQLATQQRARKAATEAQEKAAQHLAIPAEVPSNLAAERASLQDRQRAVRRELETVELELAELQKKRAAQAQAPPQYTIVPFDSLSGTTRRPIVIECRADQIVLVSEGIALTPADLDGFIPHFNPLAAGVRALADGFTRLDRGQAPYILLLVRPEGTVSYYAARMFLQPLEVPFGYELVGSQQQFTWTPTDPDLVEECRRAIDEVLRERARVPELSHVSGRQEQPLRLRGGGGSFRLDEVDRLKQPGRTVQFGDQRLDRNEHSVAGGGARPGGFPDRRGGGPPRRGGSDGSEDGAVTGHAPSNSTPSGPPETARASAANSSSRPPAGSTASDSGGGWMPGAGLGRSERSDEPYDWRPLLGSGIGIRRDVRVEITGDSLKVDHGPTIAIAPDATVNDLSRLLGSELDHVLGLWGNAPSGFYWNPGLELSVSPDGMSHAAKLAKAGKAWGLDVTINTASPSAVPADPNAATIPDSGASRARPTTSPTTSPAAERDGGVLAPIFGSGRLGTRR